MIKLHEIILEGRKEDFKEKYSTIPTEIQDRIIKNDPSSNHKYLDWMGRVVSSEPSLKIDDFLRDVMQFDKYSASLGDIYKLKNYSDLKTALTSRAKSNREVKREDAEILMDNEDWLIVAPRSWDACRWYGNNTKWCIVGNKSYWNDYYYENSIVIVHDRQNGEKYAAVGDSVYDAQDHQSSRGRNNAEWPDEVVETVDNYIENDYVETRRDEYEEKLINDYYEEYGKDEVWKDYIKLLHTEYSLPKKESMELFKSIASELGVSDSDFEASSDFFLHDTIMNHGKDSIGRMSHSADVESASKERLLGEPLQDWIENTAADYISKMRGVELYLDIIREAVGHKTYTYLVDNQNIEEVLYQSIKQYNDRMNSKSQMNLPGIESGSEKFRIRNISDIIYILNKGGHEQLAQFVKSNVKLHEHKRFIRNGRIKLKNMLMESESKSVVTKRIELAFDFFKKKLHIMVPVSIEMADSLSDDEQGNITVTYNKKGIPEKFHIKIAKISKMVRLLEDEHISVLAHELSHAEQMLSGKLNAKNHTWMGEPISNFTNYYHQPWESLARKSARELVVEFNRAMRDGKLK